MKKIYFVGGSPCAGKSTACEIISKKYNLYYFKVDDYMKIASSNHKSLCKKNFKYYIIKKGNMFLICLRDVQIK